MTYPDGRVEEGNWKEDEFLSDESAKGRISDGNTKT
jgi:hypothetical protein